MPDTRAPDAPPKDDWARVVRERGLRVTPTIVRVLRRLAIAPAPMTHEEILDALPADGSGVPDRVTLYRVLERLTEAHLCDTFTGADRRNRFVLRTHGTGHVFECSQCHKVVPLAPDPDLPGILDRLSKSLRRKGLETEEAMVTLRGTCRDCGAGSGRR